MMHTLVACVIGFLLAGSRLSKYRAFNYIMSFLSGGPV